MSYYDDKRKATRMIDEMIANDKSVDEMEFKISTLFGFNRKMVEKRIELIKKLTKGKTEE